VSVVVAPVDLTVDADPHRLTQVLANLVDNALRHGGTRAQISARRDGGDVRIEVADDGPGIPEADRARVFERFYRRGGRTEGSGFGLGLAIVGWIVALHEGRVWAEANEPHGCRMVVCLPAHAPTA
jgi:signal transduction histidine kinase